MAHQSNISVGGHTVPVWEFDSTAQQIDDAVAVLGAAGTPQGAIAALGAGVRPNLLDNAYFVGGGTGWGVFPVNQKGVLSGSVDRVFICDRWNQFGSEWELTPDGVVMAKRSDADYWSFFQVIQTSMLSALVGEKLTASVLFDNSFVTSTQVLTDNVTAFLFANGERIEVNANNGGVQYYGGNVTRTVKAIKLEVGEGQTLAYQKADGKWAMLPQGLNYQQELAKCQAYLWVPQQKNGYTVLGVGHAENANIAWVTVVPPVSMRTGGTPTVKISDASALNLRGSSIVTATGVSVDQATNGTPILLRVEGTFTPGEALDVFLANSASIEFSREL